MPTLDEYMARKYPIFVEPGEESGFIATYPDLPGIVAHGATYNKVVKNAEALREEWIRGQLEDGWPVPVPDELASCKGSLTVRIPVSLHRRLKQRAKREGVSLNQWVSTILARSEPTATSDRKAKGDSKASRAA